MTPTSSSVTSRRETQLVLSKKEYYAQVLDIQPDVYEAKIAPFLHSAIRKSDTEPLARKPSKHDLYGKKKGDNRELLYAVGDTPQY